MLIRFWRDERAATLIEYCILAGLVAVLIAAGATAVGTKLAAEYYGKVGAGLR